MKMEAAYLSETTYAVSQLAWIKSVHNLVPLIILFAKHDGDPIEGDRTLRTKRGGGGDAKHVDPRKFDREEWKEATALDWACVNKFVWLRTDIGST